VVAGVEKARARSVDPAAVEGGGIDEARRGPVALGEAPA
jgi:hypothetical protein